jgi:hypothetical protein
MCTGRRANQVTDHDPVSSVYCRHGRTGYHCRFGSERAWAEQVVVPVRNIVPLSGDADPLQLSMLGINPVTAYREAGRSQNAECRASRTSGRSGAAIRRRPWWFSTSTRLRLQRHEINCFPGSRARMFGSRSRIRRHFLAWVACTRRVEGIVGSSGIYRSMGREVARRPSRRLMTQGPKAPFTDSGT